MTEQEYIETICAENKFLKDQLNQIYRGHADQKYGHVTYSQHGEDLMLLNIFDLLGIKNPSYLDIGAHHPETISNTKLLYDRGSRGVNVEANSNLIGAFTKARPYDTNICIGVGAETGVMNFHMYSETSGRNTFSYEETKTIESILTVTGITRIPVVTINMIIDLHCNGIFPDLLSIDVEGWDYAILESANFSKSAPKVIIIETRKHDTMRMHSMICGQGFGYYCRMGENLIFIHDDYINATG